MGPTGPGEHMMEITRNGTQPSGKGPAEWFTGTVRVSTDERRAILEKVARVWRRDPEPMVAYSPLIEVTIDGLTTSQAA